jgi:N6-adenosine-specific RNA methylase IME4
MKMPDTYATGIRVVYPTIVADPPWRYGSPGSSPANAERHYPTMPTPEIAALVPPAAEDAHLWLWALNGMMEDAYHVCRSWGFSPITLITWCKPQPGVGHYFRTNTEQCIFAARGRPMVPDTKPLGTWFRWPRGRHSEKPDAFYDLVEQVSPGPRLEMFSRRARLGDWVTWGDEALDGMGALA